MSALRNVIQRRNHRERAQPLERQKWGLLEKRKDYKLRAHDYKNKQRTLKALQAKARDRNEDEFYFAMTSSQSRSGIRIAKRGVENGGSSNLSPEVIQLMKTQDAGYLRTVLQQTKKQKARLQEEVAVGDFGVQTAVAKPSAKRIVFGEDGKKTQSKTASQDEGTDDDEEEDNIDLDDASESDDHRADKSDAGTRGRALSANRRKLESLRERERELETALRSVEDQRAKTKGTIGGTNSAGIKFKMRRKR